MGKASHLGATGWGPQHSAGSSDRTQQEDGGERTGAPRVGAREKAVLLSAGWGDAADRRTQAVPGDQRRKFACLPPSFSLGPRRQICKSCPGWGAGDRAPRDSPSFPAVPLFAETGVGGRAGRPAALSRAPLCSADWGGPGRSPRDTRPGRAAIRRRRHPGSAPAFPPALHLARLSSARLLCARWGPTARRGRSGSPPPTLAAATLPSRPSAPVPEGGRPGSHQGVCLQTVLQQSALGCLPGRQQGSVPAPALGHMPPPLPPRCREPAFCLSAVRQGVFIDGAAVLRCVRFQLLRCAPRDARLTRGRSEARLLPRPAH